MTNDPGWRNTQIPPNYVPYGSQPAPTRSGPLIAAGVMAIIEGAFLAFIGVGALVLAGDGDEGGWLHDLVVAVGVVFAAAGAFLLVAGIGGVLRRMWGKVLLIIVNSFGVLLGLLALRQGGGSGGGLFLVLGGVGLGLAIAGRTR